MELKVLLDLLCLFSREDLRLSNFLAFPFGSVCLATLTDIVSLFRDDGSEVLEHKAQARVHEEVFHALFLVFVANIYEELLQDCISFHLGLNLGTFFLLCIILVGLVHNCKVADLLEVWGAESPLNLGEDFILGLILA